MLWVLWIQGLVLRHCVSALVAVQAVGDELLDSIVSDNIPIFTEEEKYNQTVLSSVERIEAQLTGQKVPGKTSNHSVQPDGVVC